MNSVPSILQSYIAPGKVFIVSKLVCPYCDKAKNLLKDLEVKFDVIEYENFNDNNELVEAFHKHSGFKTYPKIYIGTKCIGGFTDLNKLFQTMKLFDLLKEEGISYAEI
jgi:glutaredoxin 3